MDAGANTSTEAVVLSFSRSKLMRRYFPFFSHLSRKCAWHPPKARAFVDIIVPLEIPPRANELAKLTAPGGKFDASKLSEAYWRPRLGIEWIVQVFTGTEWKYGRATLWRKWEVIR